MTSLALERQRTITQVQALAARLGIRGKAKPVHLENQGWEGWLNAVFPDVFDCAFTPDHHKLWDWAWPVVLALRDRQLVPNPNVILDILSRGFGKSSHAELLTVAAMCVIGRGIFLYVCGTQDLANDHLANIEPLLTSEGVRQYYPLAAEPERGMTGQTKNWKQQKLSTRLGPMLVAVGLNVGVRGLRKKKDRVIWFTLDDVDDWDDSPAVSQSKAETLARSVLPTADPNYGVVGAQNLIAEHTVFNLIYERRDEMLAERQIIGPTPAFRNLVTDTIGGRTVILSADPVWPERVTVEVGQRFIDTFGYKRFLAEFQHNLKASAQCLVLHAFSEERNVISWSQFERLFGMRRIPPHWKVEVGHDWGSTEGHPAVISAVATAAANSRLPGARFLFWGHRYPEGVQTQTVAADIFCWLRPRGQESLDAQLRTVVERLNFRDTEIRNGAAEFLRRKVREFEQSSHHLAEFEQVIRWAHSHEHKASRDVYAQGYGIPFAACNPGADGGIEQMNTLFAPDRYRSHPFSLDQQDATGKYALGCPFFYWIVEDDQLERAVDDRGLLRHRAEVSTWRNRPEKLTEAGIQPTKPVKWMDDGMNSLMMISVKWGPVATPPTEAEQIEARMPSHLKHEQFIAQPVIDPLYALARADALARVTREIEEESRTDGGSCTPWNNSL